MPAYTAELAALAEREAFHLALVESLPQNILRKDLQGRFTFGNSRFCQTLGLELEDILGKTDADFYPPELAAKYQADDQHVIATGQGYEVVEVNQTAAGPTHVRVLKTPVRDARGAIIGIQGIFWDVTEQTRLDEALQYERQLLRSLLDACPDSIYFKDTHGRFLQVSQTVARQLGIADPADAIGKTDTDFFGDEHFQASLKDEQHIISTNQSIVGQVRREHYADGQDHWVTITKMPLRDASGAVIGTFGVTHDITEVKRAEAAAVASARLKAEFLANMSHEIRTPLNAVVGISSLLLDTQLDSEQQEFANTIRMSADLLLGIINDILDFSKIEAGKLALETIDMDVRAIVEETADLLAERAQAKGLELATWMPPDVPQFLRGDPGRLRQILVNLTNNAVKFTERGEVIVQVHAVRETPQDVTLRIEVRDTGVGVPAEAQTRLFSAFSQADGSMTRRYGGTGLGLAISKQLVTLMSGEIGFDSVANQGSTFWFELTFERQATGGRTLGDASLEGVRVLIVDDNQTTRAILHDQISAWKMRNDGVKSGADALAALRREAAAGNPYAVVILDMQMPDMDGLAVARAIKADSAISAARIVILTTVAYHPNEEASEDNGVSAYLTKPVKQSRLFDCLSTVVGDLLGVHGTADAPLEPAKTRAVLARRSLRVLLAEDNAVNQKVALRQLQKLGVTADAVANGAEVLAVVKAKVYDVILMDCQMPEVDGYEATRRIREYERQHPDQPRRHIIALTAHALDGDRAYCLAAGMDDYLSKPLRLEDLAHALERSPLPSPSSSNPAAPASVR